MKHIQKTLKERWITEPMNYNIPQPKRHTHSYMTMYQNQLKTNKGLLLALGFTIITAFGYGVGASIRDGYRKAEIARLHSEIDKGLSAYVQAESAYNNVVELLLAPDTKTPEQIINMVFKENAPLMTAVARCESGLNPKAKNKNSTARGLFQVMASVHDVNEKWLLDPTINTLIAKKLFDASGTQPWISSSSCWNK